MSELLDDTWHSRDFPVLVEVVRGMEPWPHSAALFEGFASTALR
jgi:hypothetical protein